MIRPSVDLHCLFEIVPVIVDAFVNRHKLEEAKAAGKTGPMRDYLEIQVDVLIAAACDGAVRGRPGRKQFFTSDCKTGRPPTESCMARTYNCDMCTPARC